MRNKNVSEMITPAWHRQKCHFLRSLFGQFLFGVVIRVHHLLVLAIPSKSKGKERGRQLENTTLYILILFSDITILSLLGWQTKLVCAWDIVWLKSELFQFFGPTTFYKWSQKVTHDFMWQVKIKETRKMALLLSVFTTEAWGIGVDQ